jgi:hypothetical protein
MQAVDPAGLAPGGSHPDPHTEANGGLFEARLAAAFSNEGAGEAPPDQAALGDETFETSVSPALGPLSTEAMVAIAMPQPMAGDDVRATEPSPVDLVAEGSDGIADDVGRVVEVARGQADSGSTDVRMLMAGSDAEPVSSRRQVVQPPAVQEQDSAFGDSRHPQDGDLTAAATPSSGRPSNDDSPEGRTHASGRDASAASADTAAGVSRPVPGRATAAPSVEEQATTKPAVPIARTEPVAADARPAAHAGADPSGADVAGRPRPRSMEPRLETPVVATPAAPPGAATQDAFAGDVQRGPGHEPSLASPSAAPRASSPAAPMFFQAAEGLPGTAATAPGTAAVASYAVMSPQDRAENLGRLVQSMRVVVRDGASEATVRLRPEHLGDVSISLRVDGRSVSAVVRAEAASVREWLQTQQDSLRQGLALQGLSLDRLEIEPDGRRNERDGGADEEDRPRRPRSRSVDPDSRFEVLV